MAKSDDFWTHESVKPLAEKGDPVAEIMGWANHVVLDAVENGWNGPPFDSFELASMLQISIIPSESVRDARLVPHGEDSFRIEYNPVQPQTRMRYSVAHEIAHTFFPDCREKIRNRVSRAEMAHDEWQLEMLCNIAASEILMPVGSFPEIGDAEFSIGTLLNLRGKFNVSTEAVLLRFLKLSRIPCAVFAASPQSDESDRLRIDYLLAANNWKPPVKHGYVLPSKCVAYECKTIGYTAIGDEFWQSESEEIHVECVAIPPYPGIERPRIVGLVRPVRAKKSVKPEIRYIVGDATEPRGEGVKIIAHVINDATPQWGAGFARALARKFPKVADDFITWVKEDRRRLSLRNCRSFEIRSEILAFHMIAQKGLKHPSRATIRYNELEACLKKLSHFAHEQRATVHMPRIGCGNAGGKWEIVSELIDDQLCRRGIEVTVYDLQFNKGKGEVDGGYRQLTLFDQIGFD